MLGVGHSVVTPIKPIYKFVNKYSIDFDGVDDRIITDGADTVAQPTTYSFWCKARVTGQNAGVFGHGGLTVGSFHFNYSSNRPVLFLNGSDFYRYWDDTSAQDDGEWHHWVVYVDTNDITNSKLYVDGELQNPSTTVSTGSANPYTESLTIGSDQQVGGNSFEGKIDEFAVYDRELTQAEITKIYNDGSPINLNLNAGDYQAVSDLQNYYRMGDGILDDYPLIADQTNPSLGNNILIGNNSTFDTGIEDWVTYNGGVLAHNETLNALEVTLLSTESGARISTNSLISGGQTGKLLKVSADIWRGTTTDTNFKIFIGGVQSNITISDTQTNYVVYLTPAGASFLTIYRASSGNAGTYYIDNVKVEEVQGNPATMTNMSASDIVLDTP